MQKSRDMSSATVRNRTKAPVFVLGCPRSGTTLLYDMLVSSGHFADYRVESSVFNKVAPPFGNLKSTRNRTRMINAWLRSDYFKRSGLEAEDIRARVLVECRNAGDFLRIVMESMARNQGVERWAEKTPTHLLYIPQIKQTIPDALIIHIIRDGRDVAASMSRMRCGDFWWETRHRLLVCGLYWHWLVQKGREYGRRLGRDYMEVRYEELVRHPRETLALLGDFIHADLNYDRIRQNAVGAVITPNTSFKDEVRKGTFSPVGRWRDFADLEAARVEGLLGPLLRDLDYETNTSYTLDFTAWRLRLFYSFFRKLKQRLRQAYVGRFLISTAILREGALSRAAARWRALADAPVRASQRSDPPFPVSDSKSA
jgi:Sulfotransferase family